MDRRNAVLALLQCMAIVACDQKSEVLRSHRSIIEVPTFGSFSQEQRHMVVGYDGQYRSIFEESAGDKVTTIKDQNRCCNDYYSSLPATQCPAPSAELQCNMNDAWSAVIDNIKTNNLLSQQDMEKGEAWRQFQWNLSKYNQ